VYYRFSIVNSCVTVLLLTGFLATILMRVLKNDFLKYTRDDDAAEEAEETGWKYIHGDVFRFPRHGESISFMMLCAIRLSPCVLFSVSLFCACIGTGTQLFAMVLFVFVLALVGVFYPYNRGALLTACIVLYALTAGIAGYVAANNYRQMGGENWYVSLYFRITFVSVCAIRLTRSFLFIHSQGPQRAAHRFPVLRADVHRVFVPKHGGDRVQKHRRAAIRYHLRHHHHMGAGHVSADGAFISTLVWAIRLIDVVFCVLQVLGGIAGKNAKGEFNAPCRTTKYPREIPQLPWYRSTVPQMVMAGFLPFSAIYIELYYIFASVWGHKVYTIYSILFIVFIILVIVTAFITIALTYFQLAVEDHEWWWRAVLCGGSTGCFIYGYCFYYYFHRSDMSG